VAITTLGSPWWVDRLVMGRPVPRVLRRAVIGACAPQARVDFLSLYSAEKPSAERLRRFEDRIRRRLLR
jgi:NAD(P)H dehydrogenase (quinone)